MTEIITAPEIEMLIIHSEGAYERFKRSGKKPSEFCKADLRMHNVKSYDFVKDYACLKHSRQERKPEMRSKGNFYIQTVDQKPTYICWIR